MSKVKMANATDKKNANVKTTDAIAKNDNTEKEVKPTEKIEKSNSTIEHILNPNADSRIKRLQTLNILAEKKEKIDFKLGELTNFNASNDGTNSKMEFSAKNGYTFTISNPVTITKILGQIEAELFQLQERTNTEILDFQI